MANQRKFTKLQVVYDKPRKEFVSVYLTNKGKRLLNEETKRINSDETIKNKKEALKELKDFINSKYQKNKYILTDAKPIKIIKHLNFHKRIK